MSIPIEQFFTEPEKATKRLNELQEKYRENKFTNDAGVNPQCQYCAMIFKESEGIVLNSPKYYTGNNLEGKPVNNFIGNISKTRLQCPRCKAIMFKRTCYETATMTVERYGWSVYWLKKYDVNRKVKFQAILDYRVTSQFWNGYHEARDKDPSAKTWPKPESSNTS